MPGCAVRTVSDGSEMTVDKFQIPRFRHLDLAFTLDLDTVINEIIQRDMLPLTDLVTRRILM